jgi:myo-inositol-1-phosphate synthase
MPTINLATAGVGNNISALLQGAYLYRDIYASDKNETLPGIKRFSIGAYRVFDINFVAAFDVNKNKIGKPLNEAIFISPNNYPRLNVNLPSQVLVSAGPLLDGLSPSLIEKCHPHALSITADEVTQELIRSKTDVLLYSLPTGAPLAADFYARCALKAGVAFVNCTPEKIARNTALHDEFKSKNLPLLGDDLASHMGSSIVHRTLLQLFADRGVTLKSSYQLNLGGNADFRNLLERGKSKMDTKKSALSETNVDTSKVEVIPSAGFISSLEDNKVGIMHFEGIGWGGTPVQIDLTLKVQDSSNAAGIIIDLIRIAAVAKDKKMGGFIQGAEYLLKSSPSDKNERSSKSLDALICQFA